MDSEAIRRSTWKSKLPYKLEFDSEIVRIEPMKIIEARAFGELDGSRSLDIYRRK